MLLEAAQTNNEDDEETDSFYEESSLTSDFEPDQSKTIITKACNADFS